MGAVRTDIESQLDADECDERFWMCAHGDVVQVACVCDVLGRIMGTM